MAGLSVFTARNNARRSSPGLRGPIPTSIAKLLGLYEFDVSDNRLSGTIPPEVANLEYLTKFIVTQNNLSGSVPELMCREKDGLDEEPIDIKVDCRVSCPEGCCTDYAC